MKLFAVLVLCTLAVGCGYGSNYNGGGGGGGAPAITSLSPNTQTAGTAFTLTVNGSRLTTNSVIYWGTTALATSSGGYASGSVTANITSAMDANPGMVSVYVHTGAGNSNSLTFTVN
jgi:hypothetical protein